MTQRREVVSVTGTFGDWTPITVHLNGEISARDRTAPFKGTMFAAYPGDIVFSKIDARSGAIGMLPPEISKAVMTPEFPVFTADPTRLDSAFVKLVLRTGGFIAALRRKASGTSGRKRITPEAFQDLRIPLPPLPEQQAIVAAWRAALDHAAALEREAAETEAKAALAFESALGFAPPTPLPDRPVFVANFKDIERWSHEGILRRLVDGGTTHASPWPMVKLADVIADLENGWSPGCLDRPAKPGEWGVLKVSAASSGEYREDENKALPPKLKPRPRLEVKNGDILITRASGVGRLVGRAAQVTLTRDKLMICDKIFRVVDPDETQVVPAFIAHVLGLHHVRAQIEREFSNESGMMKNVSKPVLMGLTFPLPPVSEQQKMVQALTDAHASGVQKREDAAKARAKAWTDFETAVYAAEVVDGTAARIAAAS